MKIFDVRYKCFSREVTQTAVKTENGGFMTKFTKALTMSLGMAAVVGAFAPTANAQVVLSPGTSEFTSNPDTEVTDPGFCGTCVFSTTFTADNGNFSGTFNYGALLNDTGEGWNPFDPEGTLGYYTFAIFVTNATTSAHGFNHLTFNGYSGVNVAVGYNDDSGAFKTPDYFSRSSSDGDVIDIGTLGGGVAPGESEYLFIYTNSTAYVTADLYIQDGGQANAHVFAPVPEPETYAMLLAGLGLMGFVARRRQRKLAAA